MSPIPLIDQICGAAADLIAQADGLLITAGAGIGIDSGLPDFRSDNGFWNAYPALGERGMRFAEVASPRAFRVMPTVAWGFYGHRLQLYRHTAPHAGFTRLLDLARRMPMGTFVFTSNVDGQFQQAGFAPERIVECHGSIHHLQCLAGCLRQTWPADGFLPEVDTPTCTLLSPLPACPSCGGLARPNILMFSDGGWDDTRTLQQHAGLNAWLARLTRPAVLEIGAGTAIPSVRIFGEDIGCPLIRINPTESAVERQRDLAVPLGALDGIGRILDLIA